MIIGCIWYGAVIATVNDMTDFCSRPGFDMTDGGKGQRHSLNAPRSNPLNYLAPHFQLTPFVPPVVTGIAQLTLPTFLSTLSQILIYS